MAGRGRTSFQKRQKEQLRLERRQQKAAKKEARKAAKGSESPVDDLGEPYDPELDSEAPGQESDQQGDQ